MGWAWTSETLEGLQSFLEARDVCHGPLRTQAIGDGHSNLTFLVSDGERSVVVRRPPPPPVPPGGHDMLREARLLSALEGTGVPVPQVLAVAQANDVLDVPFYVMTHVEGVVATTATPGPLRTPEHRRALGLAMIDTLAALHAVEWRARGLGALGRPEGFNARHLKRMAGLVALPDGGMPEEFAEVYEWLTAHVPTEAGAAIVHNDFRLGNLILGPEPPARIAAVLDWELATVGDPLLDLAYFLGSTPIEEARTPTQEFATAMLEPGYPPHEELIERYAERTGFDLSNLSWYVVMTQWKLAVLYEYGRRRAATDTGDPYYADPNHVRRFLEAAHSSVHTELSR